MATWRPDIAQALLDDTFPLPLDAPFTLSQAEGAGVARHCLRLLHQAGLVRRMVKGVYVAAQVPETRTVRAQALVLLAPNGCVVTDWTACWLWTGMDAPGAHVQEPVPSVFRVAGRTRLRNDLCRSGTRSFMPGDLTEVEGLVVTTPVRTAWDLGRLAWRDSAMAALDALLRLGDFDQTELLDGLPRFKGERGVVQLRELAPKADARAESPGESVLRLRWLDLPSLPPPTPQVAISVAGVEVYRLDLGVPELQYGCEYDGEQYHLDEEADRARRTDLLDRFAWDVEGVRSANVFGSTRNVEAILHEGIDRARRTLGRRRHT